MLSWSNGLKFLYNLEYIILATKADLQDKRGVEQEEGEQLCRAHNMLKFIEGKKLDAFLADRITFLFFGQMR